MFGAKRLIGRRFDTPEVQRLVRTMPYPIVKAPNGDAWVSVGDKLLSPQEISAFVLEKMREIAEDYLGCRVSEVIVTVPALNSLWSGWDVALGHHRRYDRATFRGAIAGLPLQVIELNYLFPEMIPLGLLRRWLRKTAPHRALIHVSAAFPDLPLIVNDGLFALGSASLALRRHVPAGSSLLAVLRKA